jgi:hypothetical protein
MRKQARKISIVAAGMVLFAAVAARAQVSEETLKSITTPDRVETWIGTLEFTHGVPTKKTVETAYDYLDTMRGVDSFFKGIQIASLHGLLEGQRSLGAKEVHQAVIFDKLMDSASLYLTANTSTLYTFLALDLKRDGPTVIEAPAGMLGAINDAAFRYVEDIGPAGPDRGMGGKYLVVPPGYVSSLPNGYPGGYFIVEAKTYRHWVFLRASTANGLDAAVANIKANLKCYPLSKAANPPDMEFISGSGQSFNTVHANTYTFYEELNAVVQYEAHSLLDPETRGLFASIGIEKGKKFAPDARMKRLLTDAVAIGNAAVRSVAWYPRADGTMKGVKTYPDSDSSWVMAFSGRNVFFNGNDGQTMDSDARVHFYYAYTAVTPAMSTPHMGQGSDYAITFLDAAKKPFDGSITYKLTVPKDVPVKDFWAVTIYDTETRSMLQTGQRFPTLGSQSKGITQNDDGTTDIYFGPKAPASFENNWLETKADQGWFVIFRAYGPLEPWLEQSWRLPEIEAVQ